MKRVALGRLSLYFPVVFKIPLGTELGEVDEFVCRYREVEDLAEFYRPYRQWRPYVSGRQGIAQRMSAVVSPDIPIIIRFSFEVLPILVVQKGDYFIQHRLGNRNPRAKHRPRELQRKIGANALLCYKVFEIWVSPYTGGSVKPDTLVDALADHVTHGGLEMRLG